MLNPKESDDIALMDSLSRLRKAAYGTVGFEEAVKDASTLCKVVLKREWDRLKKEA